MRALDLRVADIEAEHASTGRTRNPAVRAEFSGSAFRRMSPRMRCRKDSVQRWPSAGVADEGGWWPAFSTNEQTLDTLMLAIDRAGRAPGDEVAISLDVAASEFGRDGLYRLGLDGRELDRDGLAELLLRWCACYPILSIEDPFAEDDEVGLRRFTAAVDDRIQVIGDDFLVTSAARV